jgi:enoyl-CoA hydratase/carnithine racemase
MLESLRGILDDSAEDPSVSVFVLGSTDPACFSAGMDTKEAFAPAAKTIEVLLDVQWALEAYPKPMVAILGGHVIGGGAEVALSADVRIGSPGTHFRFPGTGYGIAQGSWHLVDAVGPCSPAAMSRRRSVCGSDSFTRSMGTRTLED